MCIGSKVRTLLTALELPRTHHEEVAVVVPHLLLTTDYKVYLKGLTGLAGTTLRIGIWIS